MITITEYLAEQKRLAEAATEGPWEYSPRVLGLLNTTVLAPASGEHVAYVSLVHAAEKNAAFIAAARESVPRLVAALEAVLEFTTSERDTIRAKYDMTGAVPAEYRGFANACDDVIGIIEAALGGETDDPML